RRRSAGDPQDPGRQAHLRSGRGGRRGPPAREPAGRAELQDPGRCHADGGPVGQPEADRGALIRPCWAHSVTRCRAAGANLPATMRLPLALAAALLAHSFGANAIEAYRLQPDEKIVLDGKLDDPAWSHAKPWDKFYELYPL